MNQPNQMGARMFELLLQGQFFDNTNYKWERVGDRINVLNFGEPVLWIDATVWDAIQDGRIPEYALSIEGCSRNLVPMLRRIPPSMGAEHEQES